MLFAAHMDEIGFIVTNIEESGLMRFSNVGGWWGHVVPSHKFIIKTRLGKNICRDCAQPPHGMRPKSVNSDGTKRYVS